MTANGNKYTMVCDSKTYFFDTLTYVLEARTADTPMTDGTLYRVRSASGKNSIRLTGKFYFALVTKYKTLLEYLGAGTRSFTLNGDTYTGWTLLSGRISCEEDAQFAECELTLAEVSE